MTTLQQAVAQLGSLSPEGIAALMLSEGIKGEPTNIEACPVAQWLTKEVGAPRYAGLYNVGNEDDIDDVTPTPDTVRVFMQAFDLGGFPELVAPVVVG